jgi:hypothetical protein
MYTTNSTKLPVAFAKHRLSAWDYFGSYPLTSGFGLFGSGEFA